MDARVPAGELLALVREIFERCDMASPDAALLADTLVTADLGGVNSHGVLRVPDYVRKLTGQGVDPRGRPELVRDSGACIVVSGRNSMGQIGARFAMQLAIERAREHGIAAAAVRDSNHCGAVGYFAEQALAHEMIGLATTNSLPTMAPWGGAERVLGINPLAVAIPAGAERPILYDAAFSGSSHGKIRVHRQKGLPIPDDWALDRDGRPTTDPAAAIDGLLRPVGAFKGAGLAMIMGILSSMLSGAAYGTELGNMENGPKPGLDGHFVAAIRVNAFTELATFKKRVDAAIAQIHSCRLAPGFDRVYAPGEKELIQRERNRREGIPLNPVTLADLKSAAEGLGVATAAFAWLG